MVHLASGFGFACHRDEARAATDSDLETFPAVRLFIDLVALRLIRVAKMITSRSTERDPDGPLQMTEPGHAGVRHRDQDSRERADVRLPQPDGSRPPRYLPGRAAAGRSWPDSSAASASCLVACTAPAACSGGP